MSDLAAVVRTTWRPLPVWGRAVARTRIAVDAEALLRLTRESIRLRHRRVAAQRFLRLQACGCAIPEDCRSYCEAVLRTLPEPDYRRMRSAAEAWVDLLEEPACI